ncbi:hypothetical protein RRG08_023101 [Elysia crispata]|uniref:Uncharacterized protein n=1 Tax=Elysia crispata TaxID=231223 RepID=A0AAE0Y9D2_9GAST|nr:hypothetical protein RRG08_023101 [Elysia crispata]
MEVFDDFDAFDRPNASGERYIALDDFPGDYVIIENPVDFNTAAGGSAETSFITPAGVEDVFTTDRMTLGQRNTVEAANDYYKMLAEDQGLSPEVPDLSSFVVDIDGRLRLKNYPDINLINERTGRPNKLTTITDRRGGGEIVRKELGFSKWTPKMSKEAAAAIRKATQGLDRVASAIETAPLEDSGQGATEAIKSAENIVAVLTREGYTSRDILGMCRALESGVRLCGGWVLAGGRL